MQPSLKLLPLISLTIFSCATNDQKQETKTETYISSIDTTHQIDTLQKQSDTKKLLSSGDTLTIDTKSAVFYQPDSVQMEKRMKQTGEDNFRAGADDYMYYMHISIDYIEKQGLPVIDSKNKRYLKFIIAGKKEQLIKLDTLTELWGIYLFDPRKMPHFADITEIEDDYKNYFK